MNQNLGRKLAIFAAAFLISAILLISFAGVRPVPVLLGGLLAFAVTLFTHFRRPPQG